MMAFFSIIFYSRSLFLFLMQFFVHLQCSVFSVSILPLKMHYIKLCFNLLSVFHALKTIQSLFLRWLHLEVEIPFILKRVPLVNHARTNPLIQVHKNAVLSFNQPLDKLNLPGQMPTQTPHKSKSRRMFCSATKRKKRASYHCKAWNNEHAVECQQVRILLTAIPLNCHWVHSLDKPRILIRLLEEKNEAM